MTQSKPAKTHWCDLATIPGESGREDCQQGWHEFIARRCAQKDLGFNSVLDVGAGLGLSKKRIPNCRTQDVGPGLHVDMPIPVEHIESKSFDLVTAFDVIEHVVEDVDFLRHLIRIARKAVFVTTPNLEISQAANGHHCREYSPAEWVAFMRQACIVEPVQYMMGDSAGCEPHYCADTTHFLPHFFPHQAALITCRDSNSGRWGPWYKHLPKGIEPRSYGRSETYKIGADWLTEKCETIEDWGCGMGYLRKFIPPQFYRGIDGTLSSFCDLVTDLAGYTSSTEGIFMRGVIEHDWRWRKVLANAVASFRKRMCLVIFTPFGERTKDIKFISELGVPDISFRWDDLMPFFEGCHVSYKNIVSDTGYGQERIIYLEKS